VRSWRKIELFLSPPFTPTVPLTILAEVCLEGLIWLSHFWYAILSHGLIFDQLLLLLLGWWHSAHGCFVLWRFRHYWRSSKSRRWHRCQEQSESPCMVEWVWMIFMEWVNTRNNILLSLHSPWCIILTDRVSFPTWVTSTLLCFSLSSAHWYCTFSLVMPPQPIDGLYSAYFHCEERSLRHCKPPPSSRRKQRHQRRGSSIITKIRDLFLVLIEDVKFLSFSALS
jgi:hypothetical protein